MPEFSPSYTALARVQDVLTQVYARSAEMAKGTGESRLAALPEGDGKLVGSFVVQASRDVARKTGLVELAQTIVVEAGASTVPVPAWLNQLTGVAFVATGSTAAAHAIGQTEPHTPRASRPQSYVLLNVGGTATLSFAPAFATSGSLTIAGTSATGMDVCAETGQTSAPSVEGDDLSPVFPAELGEAVALLVLQRWFHWRGAYGHADRAGLEASKQLDLHGVRRHAPFAVRLAPSRP